jgi:NAD(P)-dependent dehydrogenase (short-subunit alcohol dehydrogenase family)
MYTAAKHGVVGFVRSFGRYLVEESITLNAVCPNVVRTGISTATFYEQLEDKGLLTPIENVVKAFEGYLDGSQSGECMEVGPKGNSIPRAPAEHLDRETALIMEMLYERGHPLHQPKS